MSAPTLADFTGLNASIWNGPVDDEPHCLSRYYAADGRVLFCTLADHSMDSVDSRHGNGPARWTSEQAAESARAPKCPTCDERLPHTDAAGYHAACAGRDRYTADELDDVEEAAA